MKTIEEIKQIEKVEHFHEVVDILDFLAVNNDKKYNLTKAAEELTELTEVLLKTANKKPADHPGSQALIDEVGDVKIRLHMLSAMYGQDLDQAVHERLLYKTNKYLQYIKDGKYDGGV